MWDLPGPGLEPVSPALAGRFLTTAPPGKSGIGINSKQFPGASSPYLIPQGVIKNESRTRKVREEATFLVVVVVVC